MTASIYVEAVVRVNKFLFVFFFLLDFYVSSWDRSFWDRLWLDLMKFVQNQLHKPTSFNKTYSISASKNQSPDGVAVLTPSKLIYQRFQIRVPQSDFLHPEWNSDVKESLFLVFFFVRPKSDNLLQKMLLIVGVASDTSFVNWFFIVLLNFHT